MHEIAFADAVRPARCVILKLTMLDYSVGHELLLLQRRNPLVLRGFASLPIEDKCLALAGAALICYRDWKANQKPEKSTRIWEWLNRKADWKSEIERFQKYILAGSSAPPTESADSPDGRSLGAPFHAALIQFLIQKLGKTEEEAFNYPLGAAKFHYYTHAEEVGGIKIINADEATFEEYCRNEDAKEAAKAKEAKCQA